MERLKELEKAQKQLKKINIKKLQDSELRKDPRELELAYVYPGPIPYKNQINPDEIFSDIERSC